MFDLSGEPSVRPVYRRGREAIHHPQPPNQAVQGFRPSHQAPEGPPSLRLHQPMEK